MEFSPAPLDAALVCTPDWLGQALSRGARRKVEIAGCEILETRGPSALKIRMRLDYRTGQGDLPDQVCIKGIFDPALTTWLVSGAQETEALFYSDVAPRLNVRVPRALYTGFDPVTMAGHVVMEDLVPRGVCFLTALSPYSVEQIRGSLDQLAQLHAGTWNADPATEPRVRAKLAQFASGQIMSGDALTALMHDGRGEGLPEALRNGTMIFAAVGALATRDETLPVCYIHGDAHAGNIYESPEGIGLIDWQVLQRGNWSLDVAYHIAAALDIDDRRAHERALLAYYCDALTTHGGPSLMLDEAMERYGEAFAYGLMMWGVTRRVEAPIVRNFVQRLGTAASDHDSLRRLGLA